MADLTQTVRSWGGCWVWALLALLVVGAASAQAQDAPLSQRRLRKEARRVRVPSPPLASAAVSLRDNRLAINVQNQDLHDILTDIADQGDIAISQLEGVPKKRLSLRFSNLPVVAGLKRLFRAAEVESYVLVTQTQGETFRVERIMFFPPSDASSRTRSRRRVSRRGVERPSPLSRPPEPTPSSEDREGGDEPNENSASVFDELKTNTAARRLLSQLVHPNEQVRERALERLVRLVDSDAKQAELLEFLEPLMEDLSAEDRAQREEARQEVRKLLRR